MLLAGNALFDLILRPGQEFGGDDDILPPGKIPEGAAYVLLAGAALVGNGGIVKIDARLKPVPDDFAAVFLIQQLCWP